ncbi:hypothetical protein F4778DRAFT_91164 [Xylariomycetidae sp. FL2044]|nr:hypothetical protein F4778DRAFT_91164 [Xylariomycetidae sp. FL2044]
MPPRRSPWHMYGSVVPSQGHSDFFTPQDGLVIEPYHYHHNDLPLFGEPSESQHQEEQQHQQQIKREHHLSSSSATSSAASEGIASMTLSPAAVVVARTPEPNRGPLISVTDDDGSNGGSWVNHHQQSCPSTISPKMLRINPSPTPTASSESMQTTLVVPSQGGGGGDNDRKGYASELKPHHHHHHSIHHTSTSSPTSTATKRSAHHRKTRKELPSKPNKVPRIRLAPSRSRSASKSEAPVPISSSSQHHNNSHNHHHQSAVHKTPAPTPKIKILPLKPMPPSSDSTAAGAPAQPPPSSNSVPSSDPPRMNAAMAERAKKDEFLVSSKLAGMTYREIRRKGNFSEAESTLRGRFRTLTKEPAARVRKPEWHDNDVSNWSYIRAPFFPIRQLSFFHEQRPSRLSRHKSNWIILLVL